MKRSDLIYSMKGLGEVYDREVSEELIEIWFNVLRDVTSEELVHALRSYLLDGKNVYFPKPGQIYALAKGIVDRESEAVLITDKIYDCMGPCGPDELGAQRAQIRMGEVGWAYIINQGGWSKFLSTVGVCDMSDLPTYKSQTRKAIMGLLERKRNDMKLLPDGQQAITLKSLGVEMKALT